MAFTETSFAGLLIFTPRIFEDPRGYFFESFNENTFRKNGLDIHFVQDNQARSTYGVLRGLHYQQEPYAQTKLVRVLEGEILDVVVDLRQGAETFGRSFSVTLSAENKKQLLVPKGFAHGYVVHSPTAEVLYKCDTFYHREAEGGVLWKDPALGIDWGIPEDEALVSDKDRILPLFAEADHHFRFQP